jgi:hypothetical protein
VVVIHMVVLLLRLSLCYNTMDFPLRKIVVHFNQSNMLVKHISYNLDNGVRGLFRSSFCSLTTLFRVALMCVMIVCVTP